MKALSTTLFCALTFATANAQTAAKANSNATAVSASPKVVLPNDYLAVTLDKIITTAGIKVINTQPQYLQINLFKIDGVSAYIDIDKDKQFLIFNGSNAVKEAITPTQAKDLALEINSKTNLIRATYIQEKNKMVFEYYFWIKDGFTEKSFLSALDMYKSAFIYAFSLDKKELLK